MTQYYVRSFGRDCLGNCSGWEVVAPNGEIVKRFVGDIYKPEERAQRRDDAYDLADEMNEAEQFRIESSVENDKRYFPEYW